MPRARNGCAELVLLAKFGVVFHHLLHQPLDQLLPVGALHAAGHLGYHFGKRGDNLIAVDGVRLVFGNGIVGKEIVDGVDKQAMQAGSFLIVFGVVANGGSPIQASR
jgi:hypothetical protein